MNRIPLDLRGLKCPLPVLRMQKALEGAAVGDIIELRCTDPMSAIDIPAALHQSKDRLVGVQQSSLELIFEIEKLSHRTL